MNMGVARGNAGHDQVFIIEFVITPKQSILLQSILQGEDGLGVIRCFDPEKKKQQLWTTPAQKHEVRDWLAGLPECLQCRVTGEWYWSADDACVDPDHIENLTIDYYQKSAESFWQATKDHDVSQNIETFLHAMPGDQALDILDFGCGPGRDLRTFKQLGHRPTGLDGSSTFCRMAREFSACPVLHQQFLNLKLEANRFDGIFANASLFHIPGAELPRVLKQLYCALRDGGILFSSNPRGRSEGWHGQRYGHYMELESSKAFLEEAGFYIIDHYYRPVGLPRQQQPWLAIVAQAVDEG